jgi:hypothetical protein
MFFIEFYHSNFPSHQIVIHQIVILGVPTIVRTNILIRSMGPVSELDMVSLAKSVANFNQKFAFFCNFGGKRIIRWIATSGNIGEILDLASSHQSKVCR